MGYSLSVKFKNEKEKNRMVSFLNDNQDLLSDLNLLEMGVPQHFYIKEGDNISYAPATSRGVLKNLVGFDMTSTTAFMWTLCAWLSVKANRPTEEGLFYFYYDHERQFVTLNKKEKQYIRAEKTGIAFEDELHTQRIKIFRPAYSFEQVHDIMSMLEERWQLKLAHDNLDKRAMKKKN